MIRTRRLAPARRALAMAEAITIALTIALLGAAAFIVTPQLIQAGLGRDDPIIVPRSKANQAMALSLLEALHRCTAVLAVHDRTASPFLDIVLWAEDADDPGVINESEIVVLSHSRMLQTLTMHRLDTLTPRPGRAVTLAQVRDPRFAPDWRLRADVEGRVIGTGVAEMRFTPRAGSGSTQAVQIGARTDGYLLELTWAPGPTDEPDVAQALVRLPAVQSP